MAIQIVLADDHELVRAGVRNIIESRGDLKVVGEAADGRSAVDMVRRLEPDVTILDLSMPHLNGIDAARKIHAESPDAKLIVLSMHAERHFVLSAIEAGVSGYVLKDSTPAELLCAIQTVQCGRRYLSPRVGEVLAELLASGDQHECRESLPLTPREREVLQLIAEGNSNKQVAAALHISVKTVETHRAQVMEKLKLRSVAELTKCAIRHGLTSVE